MIGGVEIRDFAPGDQHAAQALVQAGMKDRWGDDFDPSFNTDTDDIAATYTTGGSQFVVAVDSAGTVIGTGALMSENEGLSPGTAAGRIVRMSVDAGHRRQGIAQAIVYDLLERARQANYQLVLVATDTPWTDAIELYKSCGFTYAGADDVETHLQLHLT